MFWSLQLARFDHSFRPIAVPRRVLSTRVYSFHIYMRVKLRAGFSGAECLPPSTPVRASREMRGSSLCTRAVSNRREERQKKRKESPSDSRIYGKRWLQLAGPEIDWPTRPRWISLLGGVEPTLFSFIGANGSPVTRNAERMESEACSSRRSSCPIGTHRTT